MTLSEHWPGTERILSVKKDDKSLLGFRLLFLHVTAIFWRNMADSSSEEDNLIRLVVVGEEGSGKSSLLHTYLHDEYPEGTHFKRILRFRQIQHHFFTPGQSKT